MENFEQLAETLEKVNEWVTDIPEGHQEESEGEDVQESIKTLKEDYDLIQKIKSTENVDWSNPNQEQVTVVIAISKRVRITTNILMIFINIFSKVVEKLKNVAFLSEVDGY